MFNSFALLPPEEYHQLCGWPLRRRPFPPASGPRGCGFRPPDPESRAVTRAAYRSPGWSGFSPGPVAAPAAFPEAGLLFSPLSICCDLTGSKPSTLIACCQSASMGPRMLPICCLTLLPASPVPLFCWESSLPVFWTRLFC